LPPSSGAPDQWCVRDSSGAGVSTTTPAGSSFSSLSLRGVAARPAAFS